MVTGALQWMHMIGWLRERSSQESEEFADRHREHYVQWTKDERRHELPVNVESERWGIGR